MLTEKENRGIDMLIGALKKKYPFVKSWSIREQDISKNNNGRVFKYQIMFYINLFIDYDELSEYSGYELTENHLLLRSKPKYSSITLGSQFKPKTNINPSDSEEEKFEYFYGLKTSINKFLDDMYKMIPEQYKIKKYDPSGEYHNIDYVIVHCDDFYSVN